MATFTFDDISKRYDDGLEAIKDMSLSVADDEFMLPVGPEPAGLRHGVSVDVLSRIPT